MAKLRKEALYTSYSKSLRIVASGTLFLTHTFSLPCHPAPSTVPVVRAHSVSKMRGGSASSLLSLLAQFPHVIDAALIASLGGNDDGQILIQELENEGVSTRLCKVWRGAGVPSAWVLHANDSDTRTVINHNPLPDITHEEFVSLLGPLLVPENYPTIPMQPPTPPVTTGPRSPSLSGSPPTISGTNSPAPFDWIHFEGRSVKTTLSNITGLDGLSRERKWRSRTVFSVDVGRRYRQGIEALIPHVDVLFLNKHYAQATSPQFASSPRAFLLSLMSIAPPHALLVAYWGTEGGAALSIPTKEYFQSSGWVEERTPGIRRRQPLGRQDNLLHPDSVSAIDDTRSVRTGSDFWADGRSRSPSSSTYTAKEDTEDSYSRGGTSSVTNGRFEEGNECDDDNDSQATEVPDEDNIVDEVGAQDAFVAGMIYALSRKIMPGPPYTPSAGGENVGSNGEYDRGRWRQLDECLRFATELSGRKARRPHWNGLAREMARSGWFNE
ncbi:hypothetical protein D9758_003693 [Tetrapyrgos nigripes]|uniref:Carbohydrate kinase PfkB domain-containing protein n=1 Tax=Tetrapyrgos nigripes TaxID=182062 RepID=A0A8H5GLW6_9AGAR|nr:hypothetical protein D9758_003693 [Tetrapyrgos nigripes]